MKQLTKKINSQYYPVSIGGIPVFCKGGRMRSFAAGGFANIISGISKMEVPQQQISSEDENANSMNMGRGIASNVAKVNPFIGASHNVGTMLSNMFAKKNEQGYTEAGGAGQAVANFINPTDSVSMGVQRLKDKKFDVHTYELFANPFASIKENERIKNEYLDSSFRKSQTEQLLNNLPEQQQYTMANGGFLNSYSNGGTMNGTNINTGGTHQSNPLGGIPIGDKGLVEEGEFLWESPKGKYIFSNRF